MPVHFPASKPYIAARFIPRRLPSQFELGSGQQEGGFYNRQLDPDKRYKVFLRAYTVKKVGISRVRQNYDCLHMTVANCRMLNPRQTNKKCLKEGA